MKRKQLIWIWIITALFVWCGQGFAATPGSLKWSYTTGNDVRSTPVIGPDETIYCGSYDDSLYALNPNGTLKWKFNTTNNFFSSPALGPDGTIYCGNQDTYIYAIKPNGTLKWKYKTGGWTSSSPAVAADGTIYCGSNDTYLYALNPAGTLKWKYKTGDEVYSSPVAGPDGTVYFGSDDTHIYAVNANGTLKWKYKTGGGVKSSPAVGPDRTIVCGSDDTYLYALNPNGILKWKYKAGDDIDSSPATGPDGTVYFGSDDKYLYAVNPNGTLKWKYLADGDINGGITIGKDGSIYFGSDTGTLYVLTAEGIFKWKYSAGSKIISRPAIGRNGAVYAGSYNSKIYAINEDNNYFIPVFKPPTGHWSGLGITNLSRAGAANVTIRTYNQNGTLLKTEPKTIPAGGQDSFMLGANLSANGWIKITSDNSLAGMNLLGEYKGTTPSYYLADVPFIQRLSKTLLIPHVAQNDTWDTTIFLTNPNSASSSVTLSYTNKNGVESTPYFITIPANGSREIPVSTVGRSNSIRGGYVTIVSSRALTAFALYNNLKTGNLSYAGINAMDKSFLQASYNYYLPVFKPFPAHWSGLGITNLSRAGAASVNIQIYSMNGALLKTEAKSIPAGGQDAYTIGTNLGSNGWIKVSANRALAGMNLLGEYKGTSTNYYLADVPFVHQLSKELLIPHVAQNTTWDTAVFLANPNAASAVVKMTYTNKAGTASAPYSITLPANGSRQVPVSTIGRSNNIRGGYVTISASRALTAFALYNNLKTGNLSYAGINAVDISE